MDDMVFERKGRSVVDVDLLVESVLATWHEGRAALREQVGALFAAGDVNQDGLLSYEEFVSIVQVVMPSAPEERVWRAFRDCIDMLPEAELGISSPIFLNVIEAHGLLGSALSAEVLSRAERTLAASRPHPLKRNDTSKFDAATAFDGEHGGEPPAAATAAAPIGAAPAAPAGTAAGRRG